MAVLGIDYFFENFHAKIGTSLKEKKIPRSGLPMQMSEMWVRPLGGEDPLEETATHSSILVWSIPWIEEPGELQSMGSQSWT